MTILEDVRQRVQPSSPRYTRYDARIRFIGRLLTCLRRNRILVSALCCAFLAVLVLFLCLIGTFFTDAQCEDFVYGEPPACNARAFLATYHYEYANSQGTPQWQATTPSAPGQYRIRAVSKNVFGAEKYSNEMTFSLLPRELRLTLLTENIIYGQLSEDYLFEHTQFDGLAPGDRVCAAKWEIQLADEPVAQVKLTQIRIEDAQGRDVTQCYYISTTEENIPLQPQPITVSADSVAKVYDGNTYLPVSYKITAGSMMLGDILDVLFDTLPAEAGTYTIQPNCTIRNSSGKEVSHYYQITTVPGQLIVEPRPLTITTGSASKLYDGKPLENSQWSLTSGSVLDSHTLRVSITTKLTAADTVRNEPVIQILNAAGEDVQENYAITVDAGTLTVNPIILKFETDGAEKMYDGTPLTAPGYRHLEGSPLPSHKVHASASGEQLFAGTTDNGMSVTVVAADGADVTAEGYKIEVIPGKLTVTRRPITITSGSAEKLYDGLPLIHHEFSVTAGSICSQEGIFWYDFAGSSQTQVGSSNNVFSVRISSGRLGGVEVTSSYDIQYRYGILTVKPNPNYKPPYYQDDPSNPGGNTGESAPGIPDPGQSTGIGFPRGTNDTVYAKVRSFNSDLGIQQIYLRSASYGNYTGYSWTAPELYITSDLSPLEYAGAALYENAPFYHLEIRLLENCPVLFPNYSAFSDSKIGSEVNNDCYFSPKSGKYEVIWMRDPGYYEMAHQVLPSKAAVLEQEYQWYVYKNYLDVPDTTRVALMDWAYRNGIRADSPTLVTDIQSAVQNAAKYNRDAPSYPADVDVAVYFLTEAKEGICQHFATAATLLYRCFNIPARYTTGFLSTIVGGTVTDITGNDAHAWVEVYQPGVGWISLEVTGSAPAEPSSTDLIIRAANATKQYDGLPFRQADLNQFVVEFGSLQPGHRLELTFSDNSSIIYPGSYQNVINGYRVLDENGNDVTDSYKSIRVLPGQLEILTRSIWVAAGSAVKTEDGTPLSCSDYWIAQGSLAEGDALEAEVNGINIYPGTTVNMIDCVTITRKDANGQEIIVTNYYTVYLIPGTLTINKAEPE